VGVDGSILILCKATRISFLGKSQGDVGVHFFTITEIHGGYSDGVLTDLSQILSGT
jgi:hypothetical protein